MGMQNVSAAMAKRLCLDASETAELGGKVMGQAIGAMKAISESSAKISEISVVIDELALQINLLALNAVLEMTRDGDHARGFASIAGQVRMLAARSAAAARETRTLVDDSGHKVEEGAGLVSRSGVLFGEIIVAIGKVDGMISDIGR